MRKELHLLPLLALSGILAGCHRERSPDLASLEQQRAQLLETKKQLNEELRLEARRVVTPPESIKGEQGVVVAIPNRVTKELLTRTLTDVVNGLHLRVSNVDFKVGQKVKAKLLVVTATLGEFQLDVLLNKAEGIVEAGTPEVSIGEGRVGLGVPLKVTQGKGAAKLRFRWAGRGLAKRVCGDLDVTRDVDGTLKPNEFRFEGGAALTVENHEFVLNPDLPEQEIRLGIEPSPEAWDTFRAILEEKKGACGFALRKVRVEEKVRKLLEEGIPVKVHTERLETVRLPLTLTQKVPIQGRTIEVSSTPNQLLVGEDYTWLGTGFKASPSLKD